MVTLTRMVQDVRTIVSELVALAPELKGREQELGEVVRALMAMRPEPKLDAAFAQELKQRLLQRVPSAQPNERAVSSFKTMLSPLKLTYALGGLAALAVVALVITSTLLPLAPGPGGSPRFGGATVTRVAANAFGAILASSDNAANIPGAGLGGGGQVAMRGSAESATPTSPSSVVSQSAPGSAPLPEADAKLVAPATEPGYGGGMGIMPAYTTYHYSYAGDELNDLPASVDVLRRIKGMGSAPAGSLLGAMRFTGINLTSFGGTQLQQFMAVQDQEFGHIINVDLAEGMVNIYENWRAWPNPTADCRDEACYKQNQLDVSAIPPDEQVIALANAFLTEHGISRASYGEPYVQNEWRTMYDSPATRELVYVPDVLTVMYPLIVEGKNVYEQYGGSPAGFGVNVNVRYSRVLGIWNLMSQNYEASAYDGVNGVSAILEYLNSMSQGYPMPLMYPAPDGTAPAAPSQIEIQLGTPALGYMRYWQYQNNESRELLLPALVFPVQSARTQEVGFPTRVVAPLVKEFLQPQPGDGPIRIMNSVPPSAGSSGTGSVQAMPAVDAPVPQPVEPE